MMQQCVVRCLIAKYLSLASAIIQGRLEAGMTGQPQRRCPLLLHSRRRRSCHPAGTQLLPSQLQTSFARLRDLDAEAERLQAQGAAAVEARLLQLVQVGPAAASASSSHMAE